MPRRKNFEGFGPLFCARLPPTLTHAGCRATPGTLPDLAPFRRSAMPARVEFRLGSIFDEPCDLLVIPSSAGGTVTAGIRQDMREAGIPLPAGRMPWGTIAPTDFSSARFGAVVFASTVGRGGSTPETVEIVARQIGKLAESHGMMKIGVPLLGTGAGGLIPRTAAASLERGFLATAPDDAVLLVSVLDREVLDASRPIPGRPAKHRHPPREVTENQRPPVPPSAPGEPIRNPRRTRVFISYSHKDARWLDRFHPHLAHLQDDALIWSDRDIRPGADWSTEIRNNLAITKVALLLISAEFLASRFIRQNELPPLLDAVDKEGATILPVHLSASRFDLIPELARFQAANDPKQPLMKFRGNKLQEELDRIARVVEAALKR